MLPLTEATRITLPVREEFETKHGARHAIQRSRKDNISIAKRRRCDHRVILPIIPTAVGVAVIVRRWHGSSATTQCNPEPGIIVNGVAKNRPVGVVASEAKDADPIEAVERDDIALPCASATDCPIAR
jgi:hypothetical protein